MYVPRRISASKEALTLNVVGDTPIPCIAILKKLGNLEAVNNVAEKDAAAATFMVGTTEFNIPLANNIDVKAELAKLHKDLAYQEGFLATVMKKLSNERFVANAPAKVVEIERQKQADATKKIEALKASIAALSK